MSLNDLPTAHTDVYSATHSPHNILHLHFTSRNMRYQYYSTNSNKQCITQRRTISSTMRSNPRSVTSSSSSGYTARSAAVSDK